MLDCIVTSHNIANKSCLVSECTCSSCNNATTPNCYSLAPDFGDTTTCCGGYYCCYTKCQTCKICTTRIVRGKKKQDCYTYSCNCTCLSSVPQQLCTVTNTTCYTSSITCAMNTPVNTTVITQFKNISSSCGSTNSSCYSDYFNSNPIGTSIPQKFYLDDDTVWRPPYSAKSIALLSIFTTLVVVSLIVTIGVGVFSCMFMAKDNKPT
jgi:hypothetical protein